MISQDEEGARGALDRPLDRLIGAQTDSVKLIGQAMPGEIERIVAEVILGGLEAV